jgi:hypothetical protein
LYWICTGHSQNKAAHYDQCCCACWAKRRNVPNCIFTTPLRHFHSYSRMTKPRARASVKRAVLHPINGHLDKRQQQVRSDTSRATSTISPGLSSTAKPSPAVVGTIRLINRTFVVRFVMQWDWWMKKQVRRGGSVTRT